MSTQASTVKIHSQSNQDSASDDGTNQSVTDSVSRDDVKVYEKTCEVLGGQAEVNTEDGKTFYISFKDEIAKATLSADPSTDQASKRKLYKVLRAELGWQNDSGYNAAKAKVREAITELMAEVDRAQ